MPRSRRVPVRDWMAYRDRRSVVLVAGPLDMTAEQLEAGLVARARSRPDYFALQSFDPLKQRLCFPARTEFVAGAKRLLTVDPRPMEDPIRWAAELGEAAQAETLVAWWFRDGYIGCHFSHMIADGRSGTRSFVEVLLLAQALPVELSASAGHRLPVARAAVRTYLRHPRGLSHVLEIVIPPRTGETAAAVDAIPDEAPPAPRPVALAAVMRQPESRSLDAWRRAQVPKVRLPAALAAGLCAALIVEGFSLDAKTPYIVWDVRRYAGITQLDATNLVGGVALAVPNPTDPQQVGSAIRRATESAQPLAGTLTEAVLGWRDRHRDYGKEIPGDASAVAPRSDPRPLPSLSMMTDPMVDQLRWLAAPADRTYIAFTNTCAPTAIAFFAAGVAGAMHFTAVCRPDAFDPDRVQSAMNRFVTDPLGLISR